MSIIEPREPFQAVRWLLQHCVAGTLDEVVSTSSTSPHPKWFIFCRFINETVLQQLGMIFMSGPLRQIILYFNHPWTIEKMACWFEWLRHLGGMPEIKQWWESEPHPAPLISNWGATFAAANFTREDALWPVLLTVIENQVLQTSGKSHMAFVKNVSFRQACVI